MNKTTVRISLYATTSLVAFAIQFGCGGSGGTTVGTNSVNLSFTPEPAFTGDSSPMSSGVVDTVQSAGKTTVTVTSGIRKLTVTLPTDNLVDGQEFAIGGESTVDYEEGQPARPGTKHHNPSHWRGTVGMIAVKAPRGTGKETTIKMPGSTVENAGSGNAAVITGDVSIPTESQPVSEGGAVKVTGTATNALTGWMVGTSETTEPQVGTFVTTLTALDGSTIVVSFTASSNVFTPGVSVLESVVYASGTKVWNGTAGQVVVGQFSHSLNNLTMDPVSVTGATGTINLSGVVVR